ncbi:MAG: Gfo/Idh/MocA family protein [Planctomycetota bacterium]
MTEERIGLGVLGCGAFGQFALSHITQLSNVELVGIAATCPAAAHRVTAQYDVPDYKLPENLLDQSDVELVYIATPPFLHYEQSIIALEAGKHVLCEKPMALSLEQAREMRDIAGQRDLMMVANLVQRYNPLYRPVKTVIDEGIFGEPLHAYFENYAKDEDLPPEHWFWDPEKSGGIFVEHGVHFFDMFRGWFGGGRVESAECVRRPDGGQEEQVQCTVRYRGGVLVNFYHGFHQPARLDRQQMRLVFERGDITLQGWIPVQASINGIVDRATKERLQALFPDASCQVVEKYRGEERYCKGRQKQMEVEEKIALQTPTAPDKEELYGMMLKTLIIDQTEWIRDRDHNRTITSENGMKSLETALRANTLAHA